MVTARRPLQHIRKVVVTEEMVTLFKTGLEILEAGDDERFEDDTPPGRRREYLDISKRLDWTLLHRAGQVSVFDSGIAEGNPLPPYMALHDKTGRIYGWDTARVQRAALMDALKERNRQDGER